MTTPADDDLIDLSVVVPVLNEPDELIRLGQWWQSPSALKNPELAELIVVLAPGPLAERCRQIAQGFARVVKLSRAGRARQLNAGWAGARGRAICFLHVDSHPPDRLDDLIAQTLAKPGIVAGAFTHGFVEARQHGSLWMISLINRLRYWLTGNYYGDQGLFVRREALTKVAGYPDLPLLEDLFMVRRLRKVGRVVCRPEKLGTSGRRFLKHGPWRTFFWMWSILIAHWLGQPLDTIAHQYRQGGS